MAYTSDKLKLLETLGNDAMNGDVRAAGQFVGEAFAELERMSSTNEHLVAKAISLLAHIPKGVSAGDLRDTLAAFKFWRASQSSTYWRCPCCSSFYLVERIVCPVSGDVRAGI